MSNQFLIDMKLLYNLKVLLNTKKTSIATYLEQKNIITYKYLQCNFKELNNKIIF